VQLPPTEESIAHARLIRACSLPAALFIAIFTVLLFAARDMGLSWDESTYFIYSEGLLQWVKDGMRMDQETLRSVWNASPYLNPHPPFFKVLSSLFHWLCGAALPFPISFRIGHIVFSAFCLTLMFSLLEPRFGICAAFSAVFFVLFQPRLFAELFLGTLDGPVALGWLLLAILSWRISQEKRVGAKRKIWAAFFILHGMITAAKITGFAAVFPVVIFFLIRREGRNVFLALVSSVYSLFFVALLSPHQWHAPWNAILSFLVYPLERNSTVKIATFYIGEVFRENTLPWHYFPVMAILTFPLFHLVLAPFAWRSKKATDLSLAILPAFLTWIVLGLIQSVPKHDGVRQFTPFLGFFAIYSWIGLMEILQKIPKESWLYALRIKNAILLAVPLLVALFSVARSHPHELSYYNELIGRLRGAEAAGFEISYNLEVVNREPLRWINANLPQGASLAILPMWPPLLEEYQRHGLLRQDLRIFPTFRERDADFLVVVRRRSLVNDDTYLGLPSVFELEHQGVSMLKIVRHP